MIYLVIFFIAFLSAIFTQLTGNKTRVFGCVTLFASGFIAIFRGAVGTDTNNYEIIIQNLQDGVWFEGMELGFLGLSWLYVNIFDSAFWALRAVSATVSAMFFLYFVRSNINERFAFLFYFIPAYMFQYSMNTLRVGLASILILIAAQAYTSYKKKTGFIFLIIGICFHYSSLFTLFFLWASQVKWLRVSAFMSILFFALLVIVVFYFNFDYFFAKLEMYQLSESPDTLSGLSKLLIVSVFLGSLIFSELPRSEKNKLLYLAAGFTLFFWILSGVSYAGLRFLDLMSFALPTSIIATHNRLNLIFSFPVKCGFCMSGVLAAFGMYRNFLMEAGDGPSPFIPYVFFFAKDLL